MKHTITILLTTFLGTGLLFSQEPPQAGLAKLKKQFLSVENRYWKPNPQIVKQMCETQRPDGSWPNIDYANRNPSSWPTAAHPGNLAYLARTWSTTPDAIVEKAFHQGLEYWLKANLKNPNWWWNEIGVPQVLALAALTAEDILSQEERAAVCKALSHVKIHMTGQNRVWVARIVMMRGMLANDAAQVQAAADAIASEICLSDQEGIRPDGCFHQHGRQPQFGNYGLSFIDTMTRMTEIFANTPFAFPQEKIDILAHLLSNGYRWIVWKGYMDVSCMGRQLMQGGQKGKGRSAENSMARFRNAGYPLPAENPVGFKYFNNSAFAVYRQTDWMASIRMATPSIIGVETWINGDNPRGGHMADGALFVYSTGREYEDVFPLWNNWRLIPGITSYLSLPPSKGPAKGFNQGANDADEISVVEQGDTHTLTFLLQRDGMTARKSWRFTPRGVIATGSGITSTKADSEVVTCVEQSLAQPNVQIFPYANGVLKVINGDFEYVVEAPEADIVAGIEERTGNPRSVMPGNPDIQVSGKVLSIYIRHGVTPKNASYKYTITRTNHK